MYIRIQTMDSYSDDSTSTPFYHTFRVLVKEQIFNNGDSINYYLVVLDEKQIHEFPVDVEDIYSERVLYTDPDFNTEEFQEKLEQAYEVLEYEGYTWLSTDNFTIEEFEPENKFFVNQLPDFDFY